MANLFLGDTSTTFLDTIDMSLSVGTRKMVKNDRLS